MVIWREAGVFVGYGLQATDAKILAAMRFLSVFTEDTKNQLTQLFDIAAKIWPFADLSRVRVMADFVDGANYRARYLFSPVIIELSYKSRGDGMLILGNDGFRFNPKAPNYSGELLHELARFAAETALYKDRGIDPYTTDAWCCLTALGWQYFYPDCLDSVEHNDERYAAVDVP